MLWLSKSWICDLLGAWKRSFSYSPCPVVIWWWCFLPWDRKLRKKITNKNKHKPWFQDSILSMGKPFVSSTFTFWATSSPWMHPNLCQPWRTRPFGRGSHDHHRLAIYVSKSWGSILQGFIWNTMTPIPSWWLNQPIWKICNPQIGSFPQGSWWK